MRRALRPVLRHALSLALIAGLATAAQAHAVLLEAQPADGTVLAAPPAEISLRFNETVTPVFVRVLDPAGEAVATEAPATATDATVHLRLPAALRDGTYVVSYRVISADSHPVGASLLFAIGPPGTTVGATPLARAGDFGWQALALADRVLFDAAMLVAVGGALFALVLLRSREVAPGVHGTVGVAVLVAAAAALLGIGIEGGLATEAPLSALAASAPWHAGLATTVARSAALVVLGLLVMLVGLRREGLWQRGLVFAGAALAAAGYAASGHVALTAPRWLSAPALWLHVLCVAFWVGSLIPLYRVLRGDATRAAATVARFSTIAIGAVALLVIAGAAMVAVLFARPADFIATPYGMRLAIKLGLVAVLLLVAAANRSVLTPALRRGAPRAALWLRRSVVLELALMAAIVVTTVTLGQATPPRALAAQAAALRSAAADADPGYAVAIADRGLSAFLEIAPARPGRNRIRLDLADGADLPLAALELKFSLGNAALGIEPSEHAAWRAGPGIYEIDDLPIPASGTWTITIAALVSDFDRRIVTTEVPIR
jgi:copper transport protein